jgi:hypothetical protein
MNLIEICKQNKELGREIERLFDKLQELDPAASPEEIARRLLEVVGRAMREEAMA